MRLLVTVTVLYLVTSSVYSKMIIPLPPKPMDACPCPAIECFARYCPKPGFCKEGIVKHCGCCDVCAKVEGERCQCSADCARGLECVSNSMYHWKVATCQPGKRQYFWVVRFELILDKFVVFLNRTKM